MGANDVRECPRGGVTPPFLVLRWSSGIPPPAWILLVLLRSRGGEPPPRHPPSLLLQGVVHPPTFALTRVLLQRLPMGVVLQWRPFSEPASSNCSLNIRLA